MIDTDKYEGHTEGLWFDGEATEISNAIYHGLIQLHPNELGKANARLAVDAPLLLAEVKRLREALVYTASLLTCRIEGDDILVTDIREYALDVVDMTVDEAMATTDLMGDDEE